MSDATAPENTADNTQTTEPSAKKGSGPLRIVLIVIMLIMLGLLGMDLYGRRASESAFDEVQKWVVSKKEATPEEVQKLVGRRPDSGTVEKEHYFQETYSWRRGRLIDTYYVTVLYANKGGEPVLHEVEKNREPDTNSIPNPPPPELSEEDIERLRAEGENYIEGSEFSGEENSGESTADGEESSDGEPAEGSAPVEGPTESDEDADGESPDSSEATDAEEEAAN
mgnify:FL=1